MNSALMFSKASDEWSTPQDFFDELDAEFNFTLDAAATNTNRKCPIWMTKAEDALEQPWASIGTTFCNPPYSLCREFLGKAEQEAENGGTVVMLVPARTDTRWWFAHVWDSRQHRPYRGVEVRFIKGRLKFGNGKNSAPFPSVVIVFRPTEKL